jgi:hypothetical protein
MAAGGTLGVGAGAADGALAGVPRGLAVCDGTRAATGSVAPKRRRQKLIIARSPPLGHLPVGIGSYRPQRRNIESADCQHAGVCWREANMRIVQMRCPWRVGQRDAKAGLRVVDGAQQTARW